MRLSMFVQGHPEPAGSKTAYPGKRNDGTRYASVVDANPDAKPWQEVIRHVARKKMAGATPWEGPVSLSLYFTLCRPKSHFRTGRHAHLLKDSSPRQHTYAPDALKLARAVEDALSGIIYRDDSQIIVGYQMKDWVSDATGEGVVIHAAGGSAIVLDEAA